MRSIAQEKGREKQHASCWLLSTGLVSHAVISVVLGVVLHCSLVGQFLCCSRVIVRPISRACAALVSILLATKDNFQVTRYNLSKDFIGVQAVVLAVHVKLGNKSFV